MDKCIRTFFSQLYAVNPLVQCDKCCTLSQMFNHLSLISSIKKRKGVTATEVALKLTR
jgi:hypothetical protein